MDPTVDMTPYTISQAVLLGPPVKGMVRSELMVLPKPADPIVASAHTSNTRKNIKVTVAAHQKNGWSLWGRIQRNGRLMTQKMTYATNCAEVIPVSAGIVLGMRDSYLGSHESRIM